MASTQPPTDPSGAKESPPSKRMAIVSVILGVIGLPTLGLLGIGAVAGLVLGFIARDRASRSPTAYGGKGLAWGGIVTNFLALLFFGVYLIIPTHVHGPISTNESIVIGDIRTVISGENAYANANGGYYDRLACLSNPYDNCIPGYPNDSPYFLGTELTSGPVKSGYRRTFHPGKDAELSPDEQTRCSPTSVVSFAYVAVPEEPGESGVRAFCGESTGRICVFSNGEVPAIHDGLCPAECEEIL